jgi:two-component system, cell cycle sensor histidine kinase and response regulator CckA
MRTSFKPAPDREITKIVAVYALFGSAWIYLSDAFLSWLVHDPGLIARFETYKGLLFILFTSALLYHLIGRFADRNARTIHQLAESEARFQAIYHNVNDALIIHDAAGSRIVDVNRTMCNMFGYSHDEALRLQIQDISLGEPPYSESEALQFLGRARQGEPQLFLWRSKRKDGALFWSEINLRSAYINGEGAVIVMVRDVTARKEAEEALRQNEEALKNLMDEMPAGVCWTDESGEIQYMNSCIVDWFGYDRSEVATIEDWMLRALPDPDYRESIKPSWGRAIDVTRDNQPAAPIEARITCKDGTHRHVILNIRRINGRILYIFTDITKQRTMQNEMLKSQKLESLGVLAGGIAHDFNNILTGILGNISFAGLLLDAGHPARKPIEQAEKASLRAAELAHQLLTFARGGQPVKKAVSVANLVQESLSLSVPGSKVKTAVDIPASLDAIEADEGQINQAFNNVIINAVQAMARGGTLTVKAENVTLQGETGGLPGGRYVKLTFSDEGSGIKHEDLQRIFDPYFTTKAGGTGLGLASVHSIVTKHNGKIEVQSVVGKGTTFTFYLPSAAGAVIAEPECEPQPESLETATKGAILLMDDEETIRVLTQNFLEFLGYTVRTCNCGEEAVRLYKEAMHSSSPYIAAIMDLTIPQGMGGKEAAEKILAIHPTARLIVSSGYSNDEVMAHYAEYGFRAAIVKPYRCAEVQQALQEAGAQETESLEG